MPNNELDFFLKEISGVIHIGANAGEERDYYNSFGLNVIWVEPIPIVFEELCSNISGFSKQCAYCYFLADETGKEYTFHIANNNGASSSIFDFAKHRDLYPDIHYIHDIPVTTTTLPQMIDIEKIKLDNYEALVLDTQGTELMILKGAITILKHFKFVKTEAADFESYTGCCQINEITDFMQQQGFAVSTKKAFSSRDTVGTYYDVLYVIKGHNMS